LNAGEGPLGWEYTSVATSGHRPPSRGGIGGAMQPLDRDNAQARRDAAAMLAATLHQRAETGEQRARMRVLWEADQAVRRRALRCANDARGTRSVG